MGKKCIPGVLCIENMTLFLMFVIIILAIYFYYTLIIKNNNSDSRIIVVNSSPNTISSMNTSGLIQEQGPLRVAEGVPLIQSPFIQPVVPINIETRGTPMQYSQVGILTKSGKNSDPLILPLMGRLRIIGRDKWQYYTVSNSGFVNTKLPIRVNGRSCTSEYGCDSINNGDTVYVEGYDSSFRVTMYDTAQFNYIPYL
jgi:hypothetical protein